MIFFGKFATFSALVLLATWEYFYRQLTAVNERGNMVYRKKVFFCSLGSPETWCECILAFLPDRSELWETLGWNKQQEETADQPSI